MHYLFFLVRYIPFWAIPLLIIVGEVAYIYWLREAKRVCYGLLTICLFCIMAVGYYYWAGGPDRSVWLLQQWMGMAEEVMPFGGGA